MCTDDVAKEGESRNQTRRSANACARIHSHKGMSSMTTRRDGGFGGGGGGERLTMRMFLFIPRIGAIARMRWRRIVEGLRV